MNQLDWISERPAKPFKDIRKQRDTVAEQKAELLLELGKLINRAPTSVANGSVQVVRQWRSDRDKAAKVAANRRSSVHELTIAIGSMRRYQ